MRNVLVGAVETSLVALETLVAEGVAPAAIFTLPASKSTRHSDWVDLSSAARHRGVAVVEAADINAPEVLDQMRKVEPDVAFVIGWSQICRSQFLELPGTGCVGYHPAPLPENRGRAVVPWTILQGRTETGGTLFWMDEGMDSGDILIQERFAVAPDETARTLYDKHLTVLARMLSSALALLTAGVAARAPQDDERATYCAKRTPADGLIDWNAPAMKVWALIRAAGDPYPGAFSFYRGRTLRIWQADYRGAGPYWGLPGQVQALLDDGVLVQCGDRNHVLVRSVQLDGASRAAANDVLRVHDRLGVEWNRVAELWQGRP